MQRYEVNESLGSGNFGTVFKATNKTNGLVVAIKRMKSGFASWKECVNCRELLALRVLSHHPHIVQLFEVIREPDSSFCLVFEYMKRGNLLQYIKRARREQRSTASTGILQSADDGNIRSIVRQVLLGLAYIHEKGFVHRDLKPENILLNGSVCKVADFGLARDTWYPPYTEYVSTRWYRAPEVLLRIPYYGTPVDMFALGCIIAELYNLQPLFPGDNEIDQIRQMVRALGLQNLQSWPDGVIATAQLHFGFYEEQRDEVHGQPRCAVPAVNLAPSAPPAGASLIGDLLHFNPKRRATATEALQHNLFIEFYGHSVTTEMTSPNAAHSHNTRPVRVSPSET